MKYENYFTVFDKLYCNLLIYLKYGENKTMTYNSAFASLSFFTVSKYHYTKPTVCDYRNSPRPHFCMGLVLDGKGVFEYKDRSVEVTKGDIIFVPVASKYVSHWSGSPDVTYISMHFSFFSHTQFPGDKELNIQKISPLTEGEFDDIFLRAFNDYERDGGCNFSALACFFEIISKVSSRLVFESERKYDERIERVVSYLEMHYSENTTIGELAAIAHMSISHFHATFKAMMGVTPIEYRNSIRIRFAIMSLIRGDKTIECISEELGFESVTYFRRVFKKETGCPPSKYNKKHMEI